MEFSKKTEHKKIYLTGHSKGGNLAMYAALCTPELESRIAQVYNFDGPGFRKSFYDSHSQERNIDKIMTILPKGSIIGRMLLHKESCLIVDSDNRGLGQHNAIHWHITPSGFLAVKDFEQESNNVKRYLEQFILSKTDAENKAHIDCLFSLLAQLGVETVTDLEKKFELRPIIKACANGASEMMSTISGSLVGILYNYQLLRYAGENGVAAYGVIMYAAFIFMAIFSGYSIGSAPIVGYHYGAGNSREVKSMLHKSMWIMGIAGLAMTILGFVFAKPLSSIFVGYDAELMSLTVHAFQICSFAFLITGINIYASSFFTALNDGGVSAAISFLRSLVFQLLVIILLPIRFGVEGIWFSLLVAEVLSLFVSVVFLLVKRKKYQY